MQLWCTHIFLDLEYIWLCFGPLIKQLYLLLHYMFLLFWKKNDLFLVA